MTDVHHGETPTASPNHQPGDVTKIPESWSTRGYVEMDSIIDTPYFSDRLSGLHAVNHILAKDGVLFCGGSVD